MMPPRVDTTAPVAPDADSPRAERHPIRWRAGMEYTPWLGVNVRRLRERAEVWRENESDRRPAMCTADTTTTMEVPCRGPGPSWPS